MTTVIRKIGKSQGLTLDDELMDQASLNVGDRIRITVQDGGSIVLTPVREIPASRAAAGAKRLIKKNSTLFKRLS